MADRNPYYRWFTSDWFGSKARLALRPETRSVYRDFIDFCMDAGTTGHAIDGQSPVASLEDLAVLLSTPYQPPDSVRKELEVLVAKEHIKRDDLGFYNDRAVAEAAWRQTKADVASRAGKASGIARRPNGRSTTDEQTLNGRSTDVEPSQNSELRTQKPEPNYPLASPKGNTRSTTTLPRLEPHRDGKTPQQREAERLAVALGDLPAAITAAWNDTWDKHEALTGIHVQRCKGITGITLGELEWRIKEKAERGEADHWLSLFQTMTRIWFYAGPDPSNGSKQKRPFRPRLPWLVKNARVDNVRPGGPLDRLEEGDVQYDFDAEAYGRQLKADKEAPDDFPF